MIWVLVAAALAFVALAGWSFASPIGASPDDNFHMTSIWCAQGERPDLCEPAQKPDERTVPAEVAFTSVCYAFVPEHSGRCDTQPTGMITTGHGNFTGAYPPVFYSTMSIFSSTDIQTSVLAMRVFSSLLIVSLTAAIYLLVDARLRAPMLWSLLLSAVPAGIFLFASVNPSGWAVASAGTLWVAFVGFFRAPTTARRVGLGALAIISALMGAGSRGDSAVYVALGALVAMIITFERTRRYLYLLLLPIVTIVMGASFYLGSGQVSSALEGGMSGTTPQHVDIITGMIRTLLNIPQLWVGNFGTQALGWGDTTMPASVWFTTLVLYAAVAFWGLRRSRDVRSTLAVVLTGVALVMIPSWIIVQNGVDVGVLVQPRYVLPLQVLFIGLLLFGAGDPREEQSRVQRWIIVVGLAVANSIALYTTMRRYLTGTAYHGIDLNKNISWWWNHLPVTPDVFWVLGSLAFAGVLIFSFKPYSRQAVVMPDSPPEVPAPETDKAENAH